MKGFKQLRRYKNGLNRFALLWVLMAMISPAIAQELSKMSISTQMFLSELKGDLTVDDAPQRAKARMQGLKLEGDFQRYDRFVAKPDTINGIVYMSAFIRVSDASAISELEALGVEIQERFIDGTLVTALIPVDKIEAVADIAKVSRVNAATMMRPATRIARNKTNVDDILTYSTDAISAGLPNAYDGSGVVLGVIDTGIDFQHIAFKDKNGNSRIKRAYVYNGSSAQEYTSITSSSPTTDDSSGDHGTHTCTTAGGSSVIVNGTTVTVTDNHANATYGGMAPGADLYLAGVNGLEDTYLSNAVNKMVTYATNQGKPLVVSNSWGSQIGPHDGTGDVADIYNSLFGDSHPNRVALFAASNEGDASKDDEGGGFHVGGTATSSNPLRSILRSATYSNTDAGYYYTGIICSAWARNTSTSSMTCKIYVLNANTGAVVKTITVSPTTNGASVSGLSTYYSGTLYAFKDYISSNKTQVLLYTSGLTSRSTSTTTKNGETYYKSNYTLAVEFAPSSGSSVIDVWGGTYGYFTNHLTTSDYNWVAGSSNVTMSDEATIANAISIGAYVSSNTWTNFNGTAYSAASEYPNIGDIAGFSSYATADASPNGVQYPWITAPGARIISGVNHYHTTSVDDYSYYGTNYNSDLVVNSSTSPYAEMEGTSMATPAAAGIVALWLQAASENNIDLTVNDVKNIMQETAIHDTWTDSGSNASHFGQGKIDALAGIEYILPHTTPLIVATPTSLDFGEITAGTSKTMTFTVTGARLEGNISLALSNTTDFAISSATVSKATAEGNGATITVTFNAPANVSNTFTGTITLTSSNATSVTVSLTGKGKYTPPTITASPLNLTFTGYATRSYTQTVNVSGTNLEQDITVTLNDANGIYSVDRNSISKTANGVALNITWAPSAAGQTSATVTLSSRNASPVTISLRGTAQAATPTLTVSPATLSFEPDINELESHTFGVTGRFISGDVSITLNDPNNVFSVSTETIAAASVNEETAVNVTVTFQSADEGDFTGTVTIASAGAESCTVSLNATVSTGGTASDKYLNIAKYATIDDAGKGNFSGTNLYRYTEYEDDGVAWLTLPAHGIYQAKSVQKWVASSTISYTRSGTWSARSPFPGNTAYYSGNGTYMNYKTTGTATAQSETFYVKNCTAVQAYLKSSSSESSNKTTLIAYECTESANGTLTESSTAAASAEHATNSTTGTIALNNLDASKIYKVVLTWKKAAIYEVAFQTPYHSTKPSLEVSPTYFDLIAEQGETLTEVITVSGQNLTEAVSVTLTDEHGVYSIDKSNISIAEAEAGTTVALTLNAPEEMGSYRATLTISSDTLSTTVHIYGSVGDKGTAYSHYLDIDKYASIGVSGWYTDLVDNPYKFAEHESDNVAWLTVPSYIAYAGYLYEDQNWSGTNSYNSVYTLGSSMWAETDVFPGKDYYVTDEEKSARAVGVYNSSGTDMAYNYYNVTNCSQVKAYGYNYGVSSTYYSFIQIYELTENADGSLTMSDTHTDIQTSTTQSGEITMTSATLDPTKLYRVFVGGYRTVFYEVAFKTPLPATVTLADVIADAKEDMYYRIADDNLEGVMLSADGKTIYCKDANQYAYPTMKADGQIDYIMDLTNLNGRTDWDQSNWVALQLDETWTASEAYNLVGSLINNVRGSLIDTANPTLKISSENKPTKSTTALRGESYMYNLNTFITCNFVGTEQVGSDGKTYFFVAPKPMEVANIAWAMWDAANERFLVPTSGGGSNSAHLEGGFYINTSEYNGVMPTLEDGGIYNFTGLVKMESVTASKMRNQKRKAEGISSDYVVYPVDSFVQVGSIDGNGVYTGVNNLRNDGTQREIARYNTQGMRVDENYRGVVIIVLSDGTARKVLVK